MTQQQIGKDGNHTPQQGYNEAIFSAWKRVHCAIAYAKPAMGTVRACSGGRLHYSPPWWVHAVPCPNHTDVCPLVDIVWHRKVLYAPLYHAGGIYPTDRPIFLCLPRAERNQCFLFVKNESIKFCCSGGFSNVPDVVEASVLFIPTVFHVRSVSCRGLYLGFRAPCAAHDTPVTRSKRLILGVPLETK